MWVQASDTRNTISMDFVVKLPQSAGHDSIMVVIDSITKHAYFVFTVTMISAAGAAHLFINHVWKHHGLPQKVISNRGPHLIAEFTWELYWLLGIRNQVGSHLLSSEFGQRCQVWSCARRWLQLVGFSALLMDASNFGGPDGVGESGVELRRSLRKVRVS